MSKALFKSIKITPLRRPLSIFTHQISFFSNKAVRVLCSERKPDWLLFNKTIFIQIVIKLVVDNLFENLATVGISDIDIG